MKKILALVILLALCGSVFAQFDIFLTIKSHARQAEFSFNKALQLLPQKSVPEGSKTEGVSQEAALSEEMEPAALKPMEGVSEKSAPEIIRALIYDYETSISRAMDWIEIAQRDGQDVNEALKRMGEQTTKNKERLTALLAEPVPDALKPYSEMIQGAIELTDRIIARNNDMLKTPAPSGETNQ